MESNPIARRVTILRQLSCAGSARRFQKCMSHSAPMFTNYLEIVNGINLN